MSSTLQGTSARTDTPARWEKTINRFLNALMCAAFALICGKPWLPAQVAHWMDAVFLMAAVASILLALGRALPFQNVLFAGALTALIGAAPGTLGIASPLYSDAAGPRFSENLPWAVPFVWILVIFTARGVARFLLRPWRQARSWGFAVIGLTVALTLVLDFGLESFGTQARQYWSWPAANVSGYGTPPLHFLATAGMSLLTVVLITPWLIRKKPGEPPVDFQPVVVWVLLNLLFASAALVHQRWLAGAISLVATAGVAILTLAGRGRGGMQFHITRPASRGSGNPADG